MKEIERYFIYKYNWSDLDSPEFVLFLAEKINQEEFINLYSISENENRTARFYFSDFKENHLYEILHYIDTKDINEIKEQYPEYFI